MRTKEEILSEIEEDKARVREIDNEYQGQYLDPESDHGKEWAERNERIDENDRTVTQIEKREARIAELAGEPQNREDGVSFHTSRERREGRGHLRPLDRPREHVRSASAGQGDADRALRAVENAHISEIDQHDDAARSKGRIEGLIRKTDTIDGRSRATCSRSARRPTSGRSRSGSPRVTRR
jgi:hypothetical protein